MDVYKPYKANRMTVKTSSYCSNHFHYQLPYWLTTTGADLKRMICIERPTIQQMADFGSLTLRRLAKRTEGCYQNLKETARKGIASVLVRLSSWDQDMFRLIEAAMNKDQVAVLER